MCGVKAARPVEGVDTSVCAVRQGLKAKVKVEVLEGQPSAVSVQVLREFRTREKGSLN